MNFRSSEGTIVSSIPVSTCLHSWFTLLQYILMFSYNTGRQGGTKRHEMRWNESLWCGESTPCTCRCWGLASWQAALQKKTWESWWSSWTWASNVCLHWWLPASWAAVGRPLPAGWWRWSYTLLSSGEAMSGMLSPVLGSPVQEGSLL